MAALPDSSVHVVCTDPPYGLEFMSNHVDWDVLRAPGDSNGFRRAENPADVGRDSAFGRVSRTSPEYKTGAGFAPVGFGRETPWPAFAAQEAHGGMNPTCATCGGRKRGKQQCACAEPQWRWSNDSAPLRPGQSMQAWHARWLKEALRILVPGGWCVSFGGARTSHRLVAAAEDVGFIIKDPLFLAYGSGMNKVGYVSRLIDEYLKVARPVVGYDAARARPNRQYAAGAIGNVGDPDRPASDRTDNGATQYGPGSEAAATWTGWGGSLRPAVEPIMVAQKPLAGTIAKNLLTHGAGAYNIDACRNGLSEGEAPPKPAGRATSKTSGTSAFEPDAARGEARQEFTPKDNSAGRWPTNLVMVHHPACTHVGTRAAPASSGIRPEQIGADYGSRKGTVYSGPTTGKLASSYTRPDGTEQLDDWRCHPDCPVHQLEAQAGEGKSRYFTRLDWGHETEEMGTLVQQELLELARELFEDPYTDPHSPEFAVHYCAKPGRREKSAGLDDLPEVAALPGRRDPHDMSSSKTDHDVTSRLVTRTRNPHPTVKAIALMRWLLRLFTPPGGKVLDPFAGSGTTLCAAALEGIDCTGIEREAQYVEVARRRVAYWTVEAAREPPGER